MAKILKGRFYKLGIESTKKMITKFIKTYLYGRKFNFDAS